MWITEKYDLNKFNKIESKTISFRKKAKNNWLPRKEKDLQSYRCCGTRSPDIQYK